MDLTTLSPMLERERDLSTPFGVEVRENSLTLFVPSLCLYWRPPPPQMRDESVAKLGEGRKRGGSVFFSPSSFSPDPERTRQQSSPRCMRNIGTLDGNEREKERFARFLGTPPLPQRWWRFCLGTRCLSSPHHSSQKIQADSPRG